MENKHKILVVDDDEIVHILIKTILGKETYEVHHAYDGSEAVNISSNILFSLIFMDIRMPKMNGVIATKTIKSHYPNLPVISISSYDINEIPDGEVFDDYVRKPFTKNNINDILIKYLNKIS